MRISLDLPEDVAKGLETRWKDLARAALESLAVEGYRSGALSAAQIRRFLGFDTRVQLDTFLRDHSIPVFEQDCETVREFRQRGA